MMSTVVTKKDREQWREANSSAPDGCIVRLLDALDDTEADRNSLAWVFGKLDNPPCILEKWHCPKETPSCNLEKSVKRVANCWLSWSEDRRHRGEAVDFSTLT
jgi:hypothetical protein